MLPGALASNFACFHRSDSPAARTQAAIHPSRYFTSGLAAGFVSCQKIHRYLATAEGVAECSIAQKGPARTEQTDPALSSLENSRLGCSLDRISLTSWLFLLLGLLYKISKSNISV